MHNLVRTRLRALRGRFWNPLMKVGIDFPLGSQVAENALCADLARCPRIDAYHGGPAQDTPRWGRLTAWSSPLSLAARGIPCCLYVPLQLRGRITVDAFRWLHLTDLHWGVTGQKHLWPEIREEFFRDLGKLHQKTGPWDVVLFSGDLVHQGEQDEFTQLDELVLGPLWECFQKLGSQPVLLTVPGNHDLKRPKEGDPAVDWLVEFEGYQKKREGFWGDEDNPYRRAVHTVFQAYDAWNQKRPYSQGHPIQGGALPGDFSTTFSTGGGHRIGVVGLNTTFLQLAAGNFHERLACDVRQFHAACPPDGPEWVKPHAVCLLMTHQGPDWLDQPSREQEYSAINPAGRFAVHLYGHMHEESIRGSQSRGGPLVRHWQGNSLFGLKHYGDQQKQARRHGYAAGTITFDDAGGAELRHWPRVAVHDPVNSWRFDRDTRACRLEEDGGTTPESILQPLVSTSGTRTVVPTRPSPERVAEQMAENFGRWAAAEWEKNWSGEIE